MKPSKALTLLFAIFIATNIYPQTVTLDPTFGENGMTVPCSGFGNTFVFDKK